MKTLTTLCLLLVLAVPAMAEMLAVVHQPAEMRDQPKIYNAKVLARLSLYTPVTLVEKGKEYYKVKDYRGKTGYIHYRLLGPVDSIVVTADAANVRSGPGTENHIVFSAKKGQGFKVLQQQDDWLQITDDKGNSGWIWKNLTWGY